MSGVVHEFRRPLRGFGFAWEPPLAQPPEALSLVAEAVYRVADARVEVLDAAGSRHVLAHLPATARGGRDPVVELRAVRHRATDARVDADDALAMLLAAWRPREARWVLPEAHARQLWAALTGAGSTRDGLVAAGARIPEILVVDAPLPIRAPVEDDDHARAIAWTTAEPLPCVDEARALLCWIGARDGRWPLLRERVPVDASRALRAWLDPRNERRRDGLRTLAALALGPVSGWARCARAVADLTRCARTFGEGSHRLAVRDSAARATPQVDVARGVIELPEEEAEVDDGPARDRLLALLGREIPLRPDLGATPAPWPRPALETAAAPPRAESADDDPPAVTGAAWWQRRVPVLAVAPILALVFAAARVPRSEATPATPPARLSAPAECVPPSLTDWDYGGFESLGLRRPAARALGAGDAGAPLPRRPTKVPPRAAAPSSPGRSAHPASRREGAREEAGERSRVPRDDGPRRAAEPPPPERSVGE